MKQAVYLVIGLQLCFYSIYLLGPLGRLVDQTDSRLWGVIGTLALYPGSLALFAAGLLLVAKALDRKTSK